MPMNEIFIKEVSKWYISTYIEVYRRHVAPLNNSYVRNVLMSYEIASEWVSNESMSEWLTSELVSEWVTNYMTLSPTMSLVWGNKWVTWLSYVGNRCTRQLFH